MRPKNPYAPSSPLHQAFADGVSACQSNKPTVDEAPQPQFVTASAAMCGAPLHQIIEMRAMELRKEAHRLDELAKFAVAMDGTPAGEALWILVLGKRV